MSDETKEGERLIDGHSVAEFRAHLKTYWMIFGLLMVGTALTVGVAQLDLGHPMAVVVALAIAITKASLVAAFFMHLIDDRKFITIGWTLLVTAFMFAVVMFVPLLIDSGNLGGG